MGKTIDVMKKYDIYVKNHKCPKKIRYLWAKPLMSYKDPISLWKANVLSDIYGVNHWCHIKIRYLWGKPLMSYKNSISMCKNNRCHIKIRYIWGKPLMSYQIRYLWEKPSMSYKNTISMGKTIDVLKDIYKKNHWCHIKIRYLWGKQVDVM